MKNCSRFYNIVSALFVFVVLFTSADNGFARNAPAEWTLMFYMDSDNNLEAAQLEDLEEMMAVGSSSKLLRVEKGELVELADWGEVDMSDPANLKKYLQTATAWVFAMKRL